MGGDDEGVTWYLQTCWEAFAALAQHLFLAAKEAPDWHSADLITTLREKPDCVQVQLIAAEVFFFAWRTLSCFATTTTKAKRTKKRTFAVARK